MIDQAKLVLDYLGGPNVAWLVLVSMAATQLVKIALAGFGHRNPMLVRPLPYAFGSLASFAFLDVTERSALVGLACGMIASASFAALIFGLRHYKLNVAADWLSLQPPRPPGGNP